MINVKECDFNDIPKKIHPMLERFAFAWAAMDELGEDYIKDRDAGDLSEDSTYATYMESAYDLFVNANQIENFTIFSSFYDLPPEALSSDMNLDEIEAFMAARLRDINDIKGQLERHEDDKFSMRSESWAKGARAALNFKNRDYALAERLRLRLLRESDLAKDVRENLGVNPDRVADLERENERLRAQVLQMRKGGRPKDRFRTKHSKMVQVD